MIIATSRRRCQFHEQNAHLSRKISLGLTIVWSGHSGQTK